MNDLTTTKKELRAWAAMNRDEAAAANPDAGTGLVDPFFSAVTSGTNSIVSGFFPIGSEIDPMPLMLQLRSLGHPLALPIVGEMGAPLIFRTWEPGDDMESGPYGIQEPRASAPKVTPALLLVPLLAFDRRGYRLGYGGGFYDRTLAQLNATGKPLAVGLAYAVQEVEAVPVADYDQPLNWIITEREAIEIGS